MFLLLLGHYFITLCSYKLLDFMQSKIKQSGIWLLLLIVTSCSLSSSNSKNIKNADGDEFVIKRGVNVSHWLSQTDRRGKERADFFTEKDIQVISDMGYDHIRLPLDEKHLWTEKGQKNKDAFQLVHQAIKWCDKYGLRIIVDLHILRSHYFNADYNPLWKETYEKNRFVGFWKDISQELSAYPNSLLAYEILNEPVANHADDWNKLIEQTLKAIRENEPMRTVVIGSNKWQSVDTFNQLKIPKNDKHLILSFHFYSPHVFTHYKAPWSKKVGFYTGDVHYPGHPINANDLKGYDSTQIVKLLDDDTFYNKELFLSRLQQPLSVAKKYGLKLFCGEFGCLPTTELKDRVAWYTDLTQVFEENDIAWANWDYKGQFGVVNKETGMPCVEIIDALFGNK